MISLSVTARLIDSDGEIFFLVFSENKVKGDESKLQEVELWFGDQVKNTSDMLPPWLPIWRTSIQSVMTTEQGSPFSCG